MLWQSLKSTEAGVVVCVGGREGGLTEDWLRKGDVSRVEEGFYSWLRFSEFILCQARC